MTFASASEGEKFAGIVRELTETVRALGPMGRVSDRLARYSQFKQDDIVAGGEDLG